MTKYLDIIAGVLIGIGLPLFVLWISGILMY